MNRLLRTACAALSLILVAGLGPDRAEAQAPSAEVQEALRSQRISEPDLRAFYQVRGFAPLWIRGDVVGPEAQALLRLIETSAVEGLDPDAYRPDRLRDAIDDARRGRPRNLARAELMLSRSFVQYLGDARRVGAEAMTYAEPGLAPRPRTARELLERAAAAPSLADYLDSIGWMHPLYAGLRNALAPQDRDLILIPPGPILRQGATGDRVRLLRQRLGLDPEGSFDAGVASAVRDFQISRSLPVDSLVGRLTLAELNATGGTGFTPEQERILRLNLARARALPAEPPRRYILVDVAAARLWAYEDGRVRDTMSVVVGRPTDQTPMIAGMIRTATLNPYWNVPPDLAAERIAPRVVAEGMPYIRERGYEVLSDWSDHARVVPASSVDWAAVAAGRREIRVRQLPGPSNAMGRMKFEFPNALGVYLHDTPERDLLREASRQRSAGCVRVEDAGRLARWMFGRPLAAQSRTPEQDVPLPEPVPVYITYLTASPEGDRIAFRADVYGRDRPAAPAPRGRRGRRS